MLLRSLAAGAALSLTIAPLAQAADGKTVYNGICVTCHGTGVAGAPRTGDAEVWKARIDKGLDELVKNVIDGMQGYSGLMPPRGGNPSLSDEEIRVAVEYMVAQSQ